MSRSTRLKMRFATVTSLVGALSFLGASFAAADTVGDNSVTTSPTAASAGSGFPTAALAWGLVAVLLLAAGLMGSMRMRHRAPETTLPASEGRKSAA